MSSLPAVWAYILPALDHIMRSESDTLEPTPLDVKYHMGIYTVIYNFATTGRTASTSKFGSASFPPDPHPDPSTTAVLHKHSKVGHGNRAGQVLATLARKSNGSSSHVVPNDLSYSLDALTVASQNQWYNERVEHVKSLIGYELYLKLEEYFRGIARDMRNRAPADDSALLQYYLNAHTRFTNGLKVLTGLFAYLNRHFIARASDEGLGWLSWQDVFKYRRPPPSSSYSSPKPSKHDAELIEAKRKEVLKQQWGYSGGSPEQRRMAEACAEAGSPSDRIIPIASLAHRCWRLEVVEPFLSAGVPKSESLGGSSVDNMTQSTSANSLVPPIRHEHSQSPRSSSPSPSLKLPSSSHSNHIDSQSSSILEPVLSKSAKKKKKKKKIEKAREKGKEKDDGLATVDPSSVSYGADHETPTPSSPSTSTRPPSPLPPTFSSYVPSIPPPDPKGRLNRIVGDLLLNARAPYTSEARENAQKLSKSLKLCGVKPDNIIRMRLDKFLKS
jgi:hypothetical protein